MAAITLALLIAMMPVVNAQTEIEGQKGLFMMLSYIIIVAFIYLCFCVYNEERIGGERRDGRNNGGVS